MCVSLTDTLSHLEDFYEFTEVWLLCPRCGRCLTSKTGYHKEIYKFWGLAECVCGYAVTASHDTREGLRMKLADTNHINSMRKVGTPEVIETWVPDDE